MPSWMETKESVCMAPSDATGSAWYCIFVHVDIWLGSVYGAVCMQTIKFLNITTLTRYPRCTKKPKQNKGLQSAGCQCCILTKAQVRRWHCVCSAWACARVSLSEPGWVVIVSGICSPVSVHTNKYHLFSNRHCKHSITTERNISQWTLPTCSATQPACLSRTRYDGACVRACMHA